MRQHLRVIVTGSIAALLALGMFAPSIGAQELPTLRMARSPDAVLKMFDANGDGRVDRSEIRFKSIEVFDRIDGNKDGSLNASEVPGLSKKAFKEADNDGNGKLSTFEYSQAEFLKFDVIDSNQDGFITSDEIAAHRTRGTPR